MFPQTKTCFKSFDLSLDKDAKAFNAPVRAFQKIVRFDKLVFEKAIPSKEKGRA